MNFPVTEEDLYVEAIWKCIAQNCKEVFENHDAETILTVTREKIDLERDDIPIPFYQISNDFWQRHSKRMIDSIQRIQRWDVNTLHPKIFLQAFQTKTFQCSNFILFLNFFFTNHEDLLPQGPDWNVWSIQLLLDLYYPDSKNKTGYHDLLMAIWEKYNTCYNKVNKVIEMVDNLDHPHLHMFFNGLSEAYFTEDNQLKEEYQIMYSS